MWVCDLGKTIYMQMLVEKFTQRFSFIAQQKENCNRGENRRKKIVSEGEGNYHPSFASFVSNRGSIVWHLNSMLSEEGNFPFCEYECESKTIGICMHLKFIDIDRLDYCLLILNLFFWFFAMAAGVCQLRFPEVQHAIKVSSIILMGFLHFAQRLCSLVYMLCLLDPKSHGSL